MNHPQSANSTENQINPSTPSFPLVSIGIPTYNRAKYIRQSIESLLSQDYPNLEIIISDNASTDGTSDICQEYSQITYIRQPENIGATLNFRFLVEQAKGEYFMWLGDDDWLDPNYISQCVEVLQNHPNYALVAGRARYILDDDRLLYEGLPIDLLQDSPSERVITYYSQVTDNGTFYGVMRRHQLLQVPTYRTMGGDWLMIAAIAFLGKVKTLHHITVNRLHRHPSQLKDGYRKIAMSDNLPQLQGEYPHLSIAISAYNDIAYFSPIYHPLTLEERQKLAQSVKQAIFQHYNVQVDEPIFEFLKALDRSHKDPKNPEAQADFTANQAQITDLVNPQLIQTLVTLYQTPYPPEAQPRQYQPTKPIIAIDGVFFQLYQTGIARVWRSLLEEWAKGDFADHIIVLDRANSAPQVPGIQSRTIPAYDYNNTEADRAILQQICDEERVDLFISTYYSTPISTPSAFMAYDMIPEVLNWDMNHPMWREKHIAIQQASAYLSISENTARDLSKFFPDIPVESVTVAHCGVAESFYPASVMEINQFLIKYGIAKPYFFAVGLSGGYKNTALFFQAFSQLYGARGFDIVCTGSGAFLKDELRSYTPGVVVHMLQLSDDELRAAYSGAIALVYPSKYEGFGLPVLEAMSCGCPVITTPNASIPEVSGNAAIYVKDDDAEGLANAMCEVQKPTIRRSLIQAGLERAKTFSWEKMADRVQTALLEASLQPFKLNEINWIIFPDWSAEEQVLAESLIQVLRTLVAHPERHRMTLLVNATGSSLEDVDSAISSLAFNLLMEEELEIEQGPEISILPALSQKQWQLLLPRIQARIILDAENASAIAPAATLPTTECDRLSVFSP